MRPFRVFVLLLLALVPLATLVHRDDLGRWDVQRSAMAAPDEFSYLPMAQHFLHGGGLSLQDQLGRDTYFPPGFPLLLAAWGKCFGLSGFTAHALNAVLLSLATLVVYAFARRLLVQVSRVENARHVLSPQFVSVLSLIITGIFATNWTVLETSLLIMSEPAFMLAVFAWLALALRWPNWHTNPIQAGILVLLAIAAWSIRGAGIVCVATSILFPLFVWRKEKFSRPAFLTHWAPLALAIFLPLAYQGTLAALSPEKSVVAGEESANSYTKQLFRGLLDTGPIAEEDSHPPKVWLVKTAALATDLYRQIFGHLDDYASSFVDSLRENPVMHFRDLAGKIFAFFGLLGFLGHLLYRLSTRPPAPQDEQSAGGFLELFILLYVGLYLLWPFNFARFWSPILPVMLVYATDALMRFTMPLKSIPRPAIAGVLLTLLLVMSAEEVTLQLGHYANRLNYVSDALANAARTIIHLSPDPQKTLIARMGDDELYALAWHFSQVPGGAGYHVRSPEPHLAAKGGQRELTHELLLRSFDESAAAGHGKRLFFFSYFPNADTRDALSQLKTLRNGTKPEPAADAHKVFQKGSDVIVWEIIEKRPDAAATTQLRS